MTFFGYSLAEIRKAIVALAGVLTTLLTANLLPEDWAPWVSTVAGILTVVGTYATPNARSTYEQALAHGRHEAGLSDGPVA